MAIVANAAISFGRTSLKAWLHVMIAMIAAGLFFFGVALILVIIFAGLLGLIFVLSFLIVVGLAPYFDKIRNSPHFHRIITGILFSFVGLLVSVIIRFAISIPWDIPDIAILIGTFLSLVFGAEILWVVFAGVVISYFLF